jgi:hypothetical protein
MIEGETPLAKYKIGDKVRCFREESKHWCGFDFAGRVLASKDTGDRDIEYRVSHAPEILPGMPLLVWESEMSVY